MSTKTCPVCGKPLPSPRATVCSASCRVKRMRQKRKDEGLTARGTAPVTQASVSPDAVSLKTLEEKLAYVAGFLKGVVDKSNPKAETVDMLDRALGAVNHILDQLDEFKDKLTGAYIAQSMLEYEISEADAQQRFERGERIVLSDGDKLLSPKKSDFATWADVKASMGEPLRCAAWNNE